MAETQWNKRQWKCGQRHSPIIIRQCSEDFHYLKNQNRDNGGNRSPHGPLETLPDQGLLDENKPSNQYDRPNGDTDNEEIQV
jgi:hypothetical protein